MLRVALRPRSLALLALMVVATVVCGFLATWQWDRAQRAIESRSDETRTVQELEDVVTVGEPVTNERLGAEVRAHGTYDPDKQVLVPHRKIDGQDATIVVTALEVSQDDGTTAVLPVARGWIPQDEVTGDDGEIDRSAVPAPPRGKVAVTGRLEASEAAADGITSDGIAGEIATPLLVNVWGGPMYSGYVGVRTSDDGLHAMPVSSSAFNRGLNWQNIGYALQWVLFGGFFLYLWWRTVRAEHLDELAARREELEASLSDHPGVGPEAGAPEHPGVGPSAGAPDHPDVGPSAGAPEHQEDTDAGSPSAR